MIAELLLIVTGLSGGEATLVQEVICAEASFSRAAERKDKTAFLALVDPDARFVTDRISRGREEIAESWSFAFEEGGSDMRWRPAVVEVTNDGNLAISRGPYRMSRMDEEGARVEVWGTFISTWRRNSDGQWRVVFDTSGESNMTPTDRDKTVLASEPECD